MALCRHRHVINANNTDTTPQTLTRQWCEDACTALADCVAYDYTGWTQPYVLHLASSHGASSLAARLRVMISIMR